MSTLFTRAIAWSDEGNAVALATVTATSGSTPRHAGAKMLIDASGKPVGTIGGGRIEKEVVDIGHAVANGAPARLTRHHLGRELAMCCGGAMELFVEPVAPSCLVLRSCVMELRQRRPVKLVTPFAGPHKIIEAVDTPRKPGRTDDAFCELLWPAARLIIFGGGHLCQALGPVGESLGFEVIVCDDGETGAMDVMPDWATRLVESFDVREVTSELGGLGVRDYALVVTRDHHIDQRILERLLPNVELSYLGLIGSRAKVERFRKRLLAKGIATEERWARLRAPVGLEVGAETPQEIAVAIAAELVQVRSRA